jgi:formiminoglutamase
VNKLPLLLSVPHAGLQVPVEARPYCVLTERQIAEDGDEGASEVYAFSEAVEALNRAEDDRRPDGVVKTHTCLGVPVYSCHPPEQIVDSLLESHYRPYHGRLRAGARGSVRLGIDCHTMLAVGPEIGPLAGEERPKICLSNLDGTSCPDSWLGLLASCLHRSFGCDVALNFPFKGGFITRSHAGELPWIQLELSRAPFLGNSEKRARVLTAFRAFCDKAF